MQMALNPSQTGGNLISSGECWWVSAARHSFPPLVSASFLSPLSFFLSLPHQKIFHMHSVFFLSTHFFLKKITIHLAIINRILGFFPEVGLGLVSCLVVWKFPHQRPIHCFPLCGSPLPGEKMFVKGDLRSFPPI